MEQSFIKFNKSKTSKQCTRCFKFKRLMHFYKRTGKYTGVTSRCKNCLLHMWKQRDKVNKTKHKVKFANKARASRLKLTYGITGEQYNQLILKQKFNCAICNKNVTKTGKRLSVDHDHKTGVIRGLLCMSCNLGLGQFQDSLNILNRAIIYLERNK